MATCAAFIEESRMKFADPTKLDRKSGEVEGSAVSACKGANAECPKANFLTREVNHPTPKQNCHPERSRGICSSAFRRTKVQVHNRPDLCHPERTPDFLLRGARDGHVCGFH